MIRNIKHLRMMFHYSMALWHSRKLKQLSIGKHCLEYKKQEDKQ